MWLLVHEGTPTFRNAASLGPGGRCLEMRMAKLIHWNILRIRSPRGTESLFKMADVRSLYVKGPKLLGG